MAIITSYASLLTAVTDYLARDDLAGWVPNFVQNWEAKFYRQPDNYGAWMEKSLSEQIAASVIPVPVDYLAMKQAYVDGAPSTRLDRVSINQLRGRYPSGCAGRPRWFARDARNFIFGPAPDAQYTIKGTYWAKPEPLRAGDDDHWIIQNAPDLPLYGALLEAQPFLMNDKRIVVWNEFYGGAVRDYQDMNREEEVSGSPSQEVFG